MNDKWFVIINPVSGGKQGPKHWDKIKPVLEAANIQFDCAQTEYIDHGNIIVENAISKDHRKFLVIGGDGTLNDVVNGVFNSMANTRDITIALFPAGTGNDWVRTTGKVRSIKDIPESIVKNHTYLHDIGVVDYNIKETTGRRYFINIAGLGFEGQVAKRLYEGSGFLKGTKLQYQLAILRSLFSYQHTQMKITVDGISSTEQVLSIACGNCQYNGGGMKQLPNAIYDDGFLDMTVIGNMTKIKMAISLPKLKNGSHINMKEVRTFKGKEITIESDRPVYLDADGEFLGETPLRITVLHNAIQVLKWI